MIRKIALNLAVVALLALMAFNGYLAVHHLKAIQQSAGLTGQNAAMQSNISGISQDLKDMETGQRGYLLTEDTAYLQPYTEAKGRIAGRFDSLRFEVANRSSREKSLETELEQVAAAKQAEMEKTIGLRQQGYRKRAFQMVDTNEGRKYMEQASGILASLSAIENADAAKIEQERNGGLSKALSESVLTNAGLIVLTALLFLLFRYSARSVEREAEQSKGMLGARDAELERMTSALSNRARSAIDVIQRNARLLLEKYEGFLPRQGSEYAEEIRDAADEVERLRRELVGEGNAGVPEKAA
jgi:CHASE3 domain sensor protein